MRGGMWALQKSPCGGGVAQRGGWGLPCGVCTLPLGLSHAVSVADGAHSPRRMPVPRSSSAHGSVPLLMGSTVWLRSKPEALRDHERGGETQTEEGGPSESRAVPPAQVHGRATSAHLWTLDMKVPPCGVCGSTHGLWVWVCDTSQTPGHCTPSSPGGRSI